MKNTLWFNEVDRNDLAQVGGKGGNLGEMVQAGLPVPDGFIVTAGAYYNFLDESSIRDQITQKLKGLDANDSKTLQQISADIKALIIRTPMPEDIKKDIQACYVQICGDNAETYVAVRSSATAEDLPGASFAGQQATYLNIHGAADVIKAVQNCWASLFEARAIFYREDKGFDHMKVGIAVPVQRMVQAEKSGIMFTVDPITNDRSKIVIEAGFGLGEAVVSGAITPDRYIIDKASFDIVDKEINEQDFMIVRRQHTDLTPEPAVATQANVSAAPANPVPDPAPEVTTPIIADTTSPVEPAATPFQAVPEVPVQEVPVQTVPEAPVQTVPEVPFQPPTLDVPQTPAEQEETATAAVPEATTPDDASASPAPLADPDIMPAKASLPSVNDDKPAEGEPFVISEADLKADLEAIKQSYKKSEDTPLNQTVISDDDNSVSLTSTARDSLTFSFSGNLNPEPLNPAPVMAPEIGETMDGEKDPNEHITLGPDKRGVQKMTDAEIVELAKIGAKIEEHYQYPQDTEWAIENGKIYIVQARPVTTLEDNQSQAQADVAREKEEQVAAPAAADGQAPVVLLKGGGASVGASSGPVKIIHSPSEIDKILEGDVLVTEMTTPDYVPAMKRATAIITNTGGRTCHAAIVSRELGIPCVVGTKEATTKLQNGQIVTVNGTHGLVYEGEILPAKKPNSQAGTIHAPAVDAPITATKVYVNLAEKGLAADVAERMVDGVGLLRAEFMIAEIGEHPKHMIKEGRGQEFTDKLVEGLRMFAEPFFPRPVIYRATDFKSNEYRNLTGGADYETAEENPMIGYRGCFRYITDPEVFHLELDAIKKVREEFPNLHVMIPFVRTVEEFRAVKKIMEDAGLKRTRDFKLYMMVEVPSTVFLIDKFCDEGLDGVSIGSNDLTQLILGVDRDSASVASEFDERDEAVQMALQRVIETCREKGVVASICGQAPSVYPEITEKLVEWGINSVSVNPDMIEKTRRTVASVERKMLLRQLSDVHHDEREELELLKK